LAARRPIEQVRDGDPSQRNFEPDHGCAEQHAEHRIDGHAATQGLDLVRRITDGHHEQNTREQEPRHDGLRGTVSERDVR
jgi:hypothetical protein